MFPTLEIPFKNDSLKSPLGDWQTLGVTYWTMLTMLLNKKKTCIVTLKF